MSDDSSGVRHHGRQMGQGGLDGRIVHGLHRIRFTSLRAALPQAGDGHQPVVHVRADQFVFNRPFEASANPADRLVDVSTAPAVVDHPLPNGFQRQRTEFVGGRPSVQFPDDLQGFLDATEFASDLAVLAVVPLGEFPVGVDDLNDRALDLAAELPTIGQELGDQAVILGPAGRSVPLAQTEGPDR